MILSLLNPRNGKSGQTTRKRARPRASPCNFIDSRQQVHILGPLSFLGSSRLAGLDAVSVYESRMSQEEFIETKGVHLWKRNSRLGPQILSQPTIFFVVLKHRLSVVFNQVTSDLLRCTKLDMTQPDQVPLYSRAERAK